MFVFNLEGLKIVVDEAVIDILTPKKHTVKHTHMREHTHKINRITMYKLLFEYVRNILNVQKKISIPFRKHMKLYSYTQTQILKQFKTLKKKY